MFAILENGSVETMLRYRLRFSTGRAFAIPTGQSKTRMAVMALRSCARTFFAGPAMAIFGPGGHVHVRSRTEKRPSSRPLLLSNRPLFAVYMPYLLSYCAGATSCPDPAVAAPPGPRLCGLCELRYGPWGVALLLLHLLLLLTGGKENLAVCHQHKHPCCCCRRCLFLPPAAFAAAVVAALPSWWSCCSSCCPSCAHHPYVSF